MVDTPKVFSVLFVCKGNICRSPTAESVLVDRIKKNGLEVHVIVGSRGIMNWHVGEKAESRAIEHASMRGYDLENHVASQLCDDDFALYDLIIAMDKENYDIIDSMVTNGQRARIALFCDFIDGRLGEDVPDPYEGGSKEFEDVLNLIEEGMPGIFADVMAGIKMQK